MRGRAWAQRSQEGKAQSRRNSRKHGLAAAMLVTGYEDAGQFEELRTELMNEHDPQSALECELRGALGGNYLAAAPCAGFRGINLGRMSGRVTSKATTGRSMEVIGSRRKKAGEGG
jgi:hypothetical protein